VRYWIGNFCNYIHVGEAVSAKGHKRAIASKLDAIADQVFGSIEALSEIELESMRDYVLTLTNTNCDWRHYALRVAVLEFVIVAMSNRRALTKREVGR
jgi:hypothetical protein